MPSIDDALPEEIKQLYRKQFEELMESQAEMIQAIQANMMTAAVKNGYRIGLFEVFTSFAIAVVQAGIPEREQISLLKGLIAGWAMHKKFGGEEE